VSLRPVPLQNKFASNCWVRGFPPPPPLNWFLWLYHFFSFPPCHCKTDSRRIAGFVAFFPPPHLVSGFVSLSSRLFLSFLLPLPNRFESNCLVREPTFSFFWCVSFDRIYGTFESKRRTTSKHIRLSFLVRVSSTYSYAEFVIL